MPIDTTATDAALAALGGALKTLDQLIKDDVAADAAALNALRAELLAALTQVKTDTNTSLSAINTKVTDILARLVKVETKLATPTPTSLLIGSVPYSYPSATPERQAMWAAWIANSKIMIINPDSGPGTSTNSDYAKQLDLISAAGVLPLGYVATTYGARPIQEVVDEVNRLYAQYPKLKTRGGIFFDEVAPTGFDNYYATARSSVKFYGGTVALNPGTDVPENYMQLGDIIMNAETTAAKYMTKVFPAWTKNYPSTRFWHVVHDCTAAQMPSVVDKIRANGAGYCYVTDGEYNVMPTFWPAFVAKVKAA